MKCFFLIALAVAAANAALAPFHIPAENRLRGRYIVVLEDSVDLDSIIDTFTTAASDRGIVTNIKRKYRSVLNGFAVHADIEERGLEILRSLPGVKYVEEDEVHIAHGVNTNPESWGIDRIDEKSIDWDNGAIPDKRMELDAYGKGTHIYVIDSGINKNHRDFEGRADVALDLLRGSYGDDCSGHGTHTAGTASSSTCGVANEASVHAIKTLSCIGRGDKADSIYALEWIASDGQRPAVASMSLGGSFSQAQNDAVTGCRKAGVVVVVSAGNNGKDACGYSPASAPDAITVGSTNYRDTFSSYSNIGPCVDILAPGDSITSLTPRRNRATTRKSGTSMAAPHVSGIAAVLLSQGFTSEEVYAKIINDALPDVIQNVDETTVNKLAYCS